MLSQRLWDGEARVHGEEVLVGVVEQDPPSEAAATVAVAVAIDAGTIAIDAGTVVVAAVTAASLISSPKVVVEAVIERYHLRATPAVGHETHDTARVGGDAATA